MMLLTLLMADDLAQPSSTTAGIITAIAAAITAFGGLVLAVTVLIPMLKTVNTTHRIVNQQRTDMQRYIAAQNQLLKKHGIEPPIDQSLPIPPDEVPPPGTDGPTKPPEPTEVVIVNPDPVPVQETSVPHDPKP